MIHHLDTMTSEAWTRLLTGPRPVVVLVPVGSVEPHGPHLALATDTAIGDAVAERAALLLDERGLTAVIAPAVAYGVTECARAFKGALSVPAEALTALLAAIVDGLLADGAAHVALVSHHLEPAHHAAVSAAVAGRGGRASVGSPLERRWGRALSDEFKRGECHAGRYETSLVLACRPELVDEAARAGLPEVKVSLSDQLRAGVTDFAAMGLARAYAGAPAEASGEEGRLLLETLGALQADAIEEAVKPRSA